jgi:prepilin-type N-terminal cleavage/methylation domain-containing protein
MHFERTTGGGGRAARAAAGFTLIEMLVVLSIIAILMGISVGALRHSTPSRLLAQHAIVDALRQAKLFSEQENAPATVRLDAVPDQPPTVTAIGKKTVGTWHLEGTDLTGFPQAGHGEGIVEIEDGVIGKAVELAANGASWIDFGKSPSFATPYGVGCELFVRVDAPRSQPLLTQGKGFVLRSEGDGEVTLQVHLQDRDEKGEPRDAFASIASGRPVLVPHRFVKIAGSFDGLSLRLSVDDAVVGEVLLQKPLPFAFDKDATLLLGSMEQPSGFAVDEVKWAIFMGETQELRDVELLAPRSLVRFGPDGALDPQFHQGPAELSFQVAGASPDEPPLVTVVRIGVLGDVH